MIISIFVFYFILMTGIGYWAWCQTKKLDDFVLGGRSIGVFPAAFGPILLISVYSSRVRGLGALIGIISGTVTIIAWKTYLVVCLNCTKSYQAY